ncbi:MAG: choloylglycine hydrolase family protein [Treponema sp.]|nr:choloylglycine hydrolase family protein [Treponema sp.]
MPCSGLTLHTADGKHLLARTFDFPDSYGAQLILIPRGYPIIPAGKTSLPPLKSQYAQAAMGVVTGKGSLLYIVDGVNEHGLGGADFYYPGYAFYSGVQPDRQALDPALALQYMLAFCKNLDEVEDCFRNRIALTPAPSEIIDIVPPLHYFFADVSGEAMVVEPDVDGIKVYRNTVGVLTNVPGYPWQETNLRNHLSINPFPHKPLQMGSRLIEPLSLNSGTWGLPGDYTSTSRFVRAAYLKQFITEPKNEEEGVTAAMHILSSLEVPRGVVRNGEGEAGHTVYSTVLVLDSRVYYFHHYDNRRIEALSLMKENLDGSGLKCWKWTERQDIRHLN